MHLFWEHGYEATSLAMLREAMGLTPPQIYNAFVDKETLFRMALARYHETELGFAVEALSAPVPTHEAIRRLLLGAAEFYSRPGANSPASWPRASRAAIDASLALRSVLSSSAMAWACGEAASAPLTNRHPPGLPGLE